MHTPADRHFTVHQDPAIDARVRADLDLIRTRIAAAVPRLELLALVGAFGRGEGTMVRDERGWRPYNDYDLVLVHSAPEPPTALSDCRRTLAAELGFTHLDVEVLALDALATLPPSMHAHDLKHGGLVFHGDPALLDRIPRMTGRDVGPDPARLLLFNRLTCLLEGTTATALREPPQGAARFRMAYLAHKVRLSTAAAALAARGDYHESYRERAARFRAAFPDRPDEAAAVEESTRFKLDPPAEVPDPRPLWFAVRDAYLTELRRQLETTFARPFPAWADFAPVHEGDRSRDSFRKLKWWVLDRRKYTDIVDSTLRVDVELAEIYLTAAPRPDGSFDDGLVQLARERLAPHDPGPLGDWEACRASAVRLDLARIHVPH
jgi:hypothetical protein